MRAMPIPILMYHNIATPPRDLKRWRSLYVHPRSFARQMALLKRLGYVGLSMDAAMPYLRGERHGLVAVVTLDDGYADNLANALPVLLRHGFSATCYTVSGALGRYNEWDDAKLGVRKPIMDAAQLRAWHAAGMEVGAHTRTHPRLSQCGDKPLHDEIAGNKADLEDIIGASVTQFCYPYGDHDERVVAATREAGYAAATTVRRGRAQPGSDLWRLPRVAVARSHILPQFAWRALTSYEDRHG